MAINFKHHASIVKDASFNREVQGMTKVRKAQSELTKHPSKTDSNRKLILESSNQLFKNNNKLGVLMGKEKKVQQQMDSISREMELVTINQKGNVRN